MSAIHLQSVQCPTCGAVEQHPTRSDAIVIRGFKCCDASGHWWSQCLRCAGFYDKKLNETADNFDPEKGWF